VVAVLLVLLVVEEVLMEIIQFLPQSHQLVAAVEVVGQNQQTDSTAGVVVEVDLVVVLELELLELEQPIKVMLAALLAALMLLPIIQAVVVELGL
jgi:hypothetical protein